MRQNNNIFNFLSLFLIGSYIFYLFLNQKLVYFIHPKYIYLAFGTGAFMILTGFIGFITNITLQKKIIFKIPEIVILILAFSLIFVQIKPLSSSSIAARIGNNNLIVDENEKKELIKKLDSGNLYNFSMYDWMSAKSLGGLDIFQNKKFSGTGFVSYSNGKNALNIENNKNSFYLSRFVISCCIVDATPYYFIVKTSEKFTENSWVNVTGTFNLIDINGKLEPVIVPDKIDTTQEPKNVYLNKDN